MRVYKLLLIFLVGVASIAVLLYMEANAEPSCDITIYHNETAQGLYDIRPKELTVKVGEKVTFCNKAGWYVHIEDLGGNNTYSSFNFLLYAEDATVGLKKRIAYGPWHHTVVFTSDEVGRHRVRYDHRYEKERDMFINVVP